MDLQQKTALENLINKASSWAYGRPIPNITITIKEAEAVNITSAVKQHDTSIAQLENHSGKTIESIAEKISVCSRCDLHKTRTNTVPGVGVKKPLVLVIGEGPGQEEDSQGLPFVGPAGQLLDKMLASIQLSRSTNCFIANIVKCRPPHNRDPLASETEACSSFLQAQIAILKPVMILAVGRIAAQNLLQTAEGIGRLHGKFYNYPLNATPTTPTIPLMATYHPSALLRDATYKIPAWEDLKLFKQKLEELSPLYAAPPSNQLNG